MNLLVEAGKPILVFTLGYLLVHLMKKHSMATSTPMDFLIAVVLGDILAQPIMSDEPGKTLLYAGVFSLMHVAVSRAVLWRSARRVLAFTPTILVRKGRLDDRAPSRERMSLPHLLAELRVKGFPNLADVEYAILEETGNISVIPKADRRPMQPADLGLTPPYNGLPAVLVADGRIVETTLRSLVQTSHRRSSQQPFSQDGFQVRNFLHSNRQGRPK